MRIPLSLVGLVLLAAPAHAVPTLIVCGPAPCLMLDGTMQPAGTARDRVDWDGVTPLSPPSGMRAVPDDGRGVYVPVIPAPVTAVTLDPTTGTATITRQDHSTTMLPGFATQSGLAAVRNAIPRAAPASPAQ